MRRQCWRATVLILSCSTHNGHGAKCANDFQSMIPKAGWPQNSLYLAGYVPVLYCISTQRTLKQSPSVQTASRSSAPNPKWSRSTSSSADVTSQSGFGRPWSGTGAAENGALSSSLSSSKSMHFPGCWLTNFQTLAFFKIVILQEIYRGLGTGPGLSPRGLHEFVAWSSPHLCSPFCLATFCPSTQTPTSVLPQSPHTNLRAFLCSHPCAPHR